jgi:hypothetical protein
LHGEVGDGEVKGVGRLQWGAFHFFGFPS